MNKTLIKALVASTFLFCPNIVALAESENTPQAIKIERHTVPDSDLVFATIEHPKRTWGQLVWNPVERSLKRVIYTASDLLNDENLDMMFSAEPTKFMASGRLNGKGSISWQRTGKSISDLSHQVALYEGNFVEGMPDGEGRFEHFSGVIYEGQWKSGRPDGQGTLHFSNGDEYSGFFRKGLPDGKGIYVDASGAIYDGGFAGGKRQGTGTVYLPGRDAFVAQWQNGQLSEVKVQSLSMAQRRFPLIKVSEEFTEVPGLKIRLFIDSTFARRKNSDQFSALEYAAKSRGEVLTIQVASDNLRRHLNGQGNAITLKNDILKNVNDLGEGFWGLDDELLPIPLLIEVENGSQNSIGIQEAWIAVEDSQPDNRPVLQLTSGETWHGEACDASNYATNLLAENYGWGEVTTASIKYTIGSAEEQSAQLQDITPIRNGIVELAGSLKGLGVRVDELNDGDISCNATLDQCFANLKGTGIFGQIEDDIEMTPWGMLFVPVTGAIDIAWRENDAATNSQSFDFSTFLSLGAFGYEAECGEGGDRDLGRDKPFRFQISGKDYEISLPIRDTINRDVAVSWRVNLEAVRSSLHKFRIALKLDDGRVIGSRPVELEYFKPKVYRYDSASEGYVLDDG